ncbi:MAG: hypothetical protein AN487_07460 [Anabaena sp. CRKS33]|jgi:hypothetical protein|nr:MAG: hypothetical protein AN487_07460 [Anabaena sp. CRKS33]
MFAEESINSDYHLGSSDNFSIPISQVNDASIAPKAAVKSPQFVVLPSVGVETVNLTPVPW